MYLIDTDILIWVLRGDQKYIKLLKKLKSKDLLAISTITIAEIYQNIFPSELVKTENLLDEFEVFDVTSPVAKQGGLYWGEYIKQFKRLSLADCLIAGTVYVHNLTLVSLNKKHFPMRDITLLNLP